MFLFLSIVPNSKSKIGIGVVEVFCSERGRVVPKDVWIGSHNKSMHPIFFQDMYFSKNEIQIPIEMKKAFEDLSKVAEDSGIPYYQVVLHAFAVAKKNLQH